MTRLHEFTDKTLALPYRFVLLGQLTDTTQYLYGIRSNNTQQGTLDDLFVADTNINTNELLIGTGTGTAISRDGLILTAHHVIKNAKRIMIETQQGRRPAIVVGANSKSDIALLKCEGADLNPIPIADSKHVRVGQSVFTVGFPQIRVQGVKPKFTKGEISGYCGIADDPTSWQISVPLQPGNSGGPLVDGNGNVIGIVVASLSPYSMFEESGSLPQNVNYAVKSECFSALLTQNNVPSSSFEKPAHSDIDSLTVETVMKSVVLILVYGGNL
jgi:S1-C subfamily serine protease